MALYRNVCRTLEVKGPSLKRPWRTFSTTGSIQKGFIYSEGEGLSGALGHSLDLAHAPLTRADIHGREDFSQISTGWAHSGAVTPDGVVYLWGRTHDMRHVFTMPRLQRLMPGFRRFIGAGSIDMLAPSVIYATSGSTSLEGNPVAEVYAHIEDVHRAVKVVCSAGFSMILTASGRLLSFGTNQQGQCGVGTRATPATYQPTEVVGIDEDELVIDVVLGFQHAVALTASGKLYSWGKGERGQLGFQRNEMETVRYEAWPIEPLLGERIVKISSGFNHTVALSDKGEVYLWGKFQAGKYLYFNDAVLGDQFVPRKLKLDAKIVDVKCSQFHTTLMTEDGQLMAFGMEARSHMNGTAIPHNTPEVIEQDWLQGEKVARLCQGFSQTLVLTETGTLYEWDFKEALLSPVDSALGLRVKDAVFSWKHKLYLCDDMKEDGVIRESAI